MNDETQIKSHTKKLDKKKKKFKNLLTSVLAWAKQDGALNLQNSLVIFLNRLLLYFLTREEISGKSVAPLDTPGPF